MEKHYMHMTVRYMLMLLDSRDESWVLGSFSRPDGSHPTKEEARAFLLKYPNEALIPCNRSDCAIAHEHAF
jgi:hypothetical protein